MRLLVLEVGGLYWLAVVDKAGVRRPLLLAGEWPSWAGGWAGADGVGGYGTEDALRVLGAFGLSETDARRSLALA